VKWTWRAPEPTWQAAGEELESEIHALFRRCPGLSGFSVQPKVSADGNIEGEEQLFVTAIGIDGRVGRSQYADIFEQISATLKGLLAERPEAHALMRGRTFARVLH